MFEINIHVTGLEPLQALADALRAGGVPVQKIAEQVAERVQEAAQPVQFTPVPPAAEEDQSLWQTQETAVPPGEDREKRPSADRAALRRRQPSENRAARRCDDLPEKRMRPSGAGAAASCCGW